jgi:hypothetical protein
MEIAREEANIGRVPWCASQVPASHRTSEKEDEDFKLAPRLFVCRSWTDNSDRKGRCKNIAEISQSGNHETFAMLAMLVLGQHC